MIISSIAPPEDNVGMMTMSEIPADVRERVLKRDGRKCAYCGTEEGIQLHHIISRSEEVIHEDDNLVTLCWTHHMALHAGRLAVKIINGRPYFKK